jgi:hypothetical protein
MLAAVMNLAATTRIREITAMVGNIIVGLSG